MFCVYLLHKSGVDRPITINILFPVFFITATLSFTIGQKRNVFQKICKGNNIFSSDIYQELSKKPGNIFFSPFSVHTILSLVSQGAAGGTLEEFNKVLKVNNEISADGYKGIMKLVRNVQNITLHLANKVYIKEGYELNDDFKTVAGDKFLTEVESINFIPQKSAIANINRWCLSKTNNKISDVVTEDDVDEGTRLVLVNAIYFKGDWRFKFNISKTENKPFYINDHKSVKADMMQMTSKFRYNYDYYLNAYLLEMDYKNRDFSMIIILPSDKNGINEVEKKLASNDLTFNTDYWQSNTLILTLPKFKIETKMHLIDALMKVL